MFNGKNIPQDEIKYRIGLISDTHMPERWPTLPKQIGDIFAGVDLILHAGDVGELWVLDKLGALAPVIAVHGNDEPEETPKQLPYQQIIALAGQRILLWHSHIPNQRAELEFRRDDRWQTKLNRHIECGRAAGANIVIYGHTHVPMTYAQDGILIVNPGAIASGNPFSKQLIQTVALLLVGKSGQVEIVHVDLTEPERPFTPTIDWNAGFRAASTVYERSILAPDLQVLAFKTFNIFEPAERAILKSIILPISHRCWAGEIDQITLDMLLAAIENKPNLPAATKQKIYAIL